MTGMALDCRQHHTLTTLTTSLGKTGSRKHSLSDVQHPDDIHEKTPSSQNDFLAVFPNAFPNDTPNDILPMFYTTEYIPHTLPPSLPIPAIFPVKDPLSEKQQG